MSTTPIKYEKAENNLSFTVTNANVGSPINFTLKAEIEGTSTRQTLKHVEYDVNNSIDVVTLLRRLRMHGFALSLLLDVPVLRIIGEKSKRSPMRNPTVIKRKSKVSSFIYFLTYFSDIFKSGLIAL